MAGIKGVSSSEGVSRQGGEGKGGRSSSAPPAKVGEVLFADVIKTFSEKSALVKISGMEITAATESRLPEGSIRVIVAKNDPQLVLRPFGEESSPASSLQAILRRSPPGKLDVAGLIGQILSQSPKDSDSLKLLLDQLAGLLKSLSFAGGQKGASALAETLSKAGLFHEGNILSGGDAKGDLKGVLKNLLQHFDERIAQDRGEAGQGKLSLVKEGVRQLLAQVESNQIANHLAREKGETQLVQIPYMAEGEVRNLKLYSRNRKKRGEEGEEERVITLMLNLSAIKKIRIDLRAIKKELAITISVENEEILKILNHWIPPLKKTLTHLGYKVKVESHVALVSYIEEELMEEDAQIDEHHALDVKV